MTRRGAVILSEMLRQHARYRPTKPALVEKNQPIDYRTLDRIVDGVSLALHGQGIRRGDLVGVSMRDTARHLMVLLALGRLGAIILPLDCRWTDADKSSVSGQFEAKWAISETDESWHDRVLRASPDWFGESDRPYNDPEVTGDTPLLLSLSSGTTGMPKGPRVTQEQFVRRFMVYWLNCELNGRDRFLVSTPLYFGGGRGFALAMIYAGATAFMFPPPYDPEALVAEVADKKITALFLVPTLLVRLLDWKGAGLALPSVRVLIASGSALHASEQRQIRDRLSPNLFQYYSSTEGGGVSLLSPDDFDSHPDSVGRPCFGVEVEAVDEEHQAVPTGEIGRIRYRSPASPDSYYRGDSAAAFHDGWFYPGDLGSFDADGFLYLRGRSKDMIIRGGINIYPMDIEKTLLGVDGVTEAAVVGFPSIEFGEEIAAFVVCARPIEADALLAVCREKLARFKLPKRIIFVDSLPKNSGGKVLKAELTKSLV